MTSPTPEPTQNPDRPSEPDAGALFDALNTEHAAIYGYGLVSAHSTVDDNELVSAALAEHRQRREAVIAVLTQRSVKVPLPAPGYQLPITVDTPADAARLAVRMEDDCADAWRAVMEQASSDDDRKLGLTALTQSAVMAARWRAVLGAWPLTDAFPGGGE